MAILPTLLIDEKGKYADTLSETIEKYCPFLFLKTINVKKSGCSNLLQNCPAKIIFLNSQAFSLQQLFLIEKQLKNKALIFISDVPKCPDFASFLQPVGHLIAPISAEKLIVTVNTAKDFIHQAKLKKEMPFLSKSPQNQKKEHKLIGIPTMEGLEVILANNIIRCEGLQKCTRIVTTQKSDIISSYPIGVFKNLLTPYPFFFFPHRSHIINLLCVDKYKKSGTIIMKDKSQVPISKNSKVHFLNHINHI